MKTAKELRAGNVFILEKKPCIVIKTELRTAGRNGHMVKLKYMGLLDKINSEQVFKADDKFELEVLGKKACSYSYANGNNYVFMDKDFNQYEVDAALLEESINYIAEGMEEEVELVFYENNPITLELPTTVVRHIIYTEDAVKGDTSGKVMKPAKINSLNPNFEMMVPSFFTIDDHIEIHTENHEVIKRVPQKKSR
jgi:elongation factor P